MSALVICLLSVPAAQAEGSSSGADLLRSGVAQAGRAPETFREVGGSNPYRRAEGNARASAPEHCPRVRAAVRWYASRVAYWLDKLGQERVPTGMPSRTSSTEGARQSCPRFLAKRLRAKAAALRREYARYVEYHWHWQRWLPDKYARVGACETGYGRRPGSWTWDSGTYVSAFGIYRPAYAQFARALGLPTWDDPGRRTPREQFLVARAIQARYGWSAWGCGSA